MSESNEHPEKVSPESWGLWGSSLGADLQTDRAARMWSYLLSTYLLMAILVPVISRCLHESVGLLCYLYKLLASKRPNVISV